MEAPHSVRTLLADLPAGYLQPCFPTRHDPTAEPYASEFSADGMVVGTYMKDSLAHLSHRGGKSIQ